MRMIPVRVAKLLLFSCRVGRVAVLSGSVDDMFWSGRATPLQPTSSDRRWEGSGVAVLSEGVWMTPGRVAELLLFSCRVGRGV